MLILSRKPSESIQIGPDIEIRVVEVKTRNRVVIGISAPGDCKILRSELVEMGATDPQTLPAAQ